MKDIDIPEVQELISQPPARLECDPLDGWLEAGAQMTVRQHMYRYLQSWLAAKRKPRADAKATVKEEEGEGMDDAPNRPLDSSICTNLADK